MTDTNAGQDLFAEARAAINNHGVIAYPTEAVFGLGCAPYDQLAVEKLLALKRRPVDKGLILIAANYSQLLDYVDDERIPGDKRFSVFSRWPGPVTLVLPARKDTPTFLTGAFDTIAVRVTAFEPAARLCKALGTPLVSTSANHSGEAPLKTAAEVKASFAGEIDWVMDEPVGTSSSPSQVINPLTGEVFRQ